MANLVGEENRGWQLIINQLNHERVTLCSSGIIERVLAEVRAWAQRTALPDGRRVIDQEWVQLNIAKVHAKLEFLRLMNWKLASSAAKGALDPADCSTVKVFGTEFYLEAIRLLLEVVGPAGYLHAGTPGRSTSGASKSTTARWPSSPTAGAPTRCSVTSSRRSSAGVPAGGVVTVDLSLTATRKSCRTLARRILDDNVSPTSGTPSDFDLDLWRLLATSGLVGVGLPVTAGGFGGSFLDACVVLEEVGRAAAPVPALAVLAFAGPALARFGNPDDLDGVASGSRIVTAALHEPTGSMHSPALVVRDGRLTGTKVCVPAGMVADRYVVSTAEGLHAVERDASGLGVERSDTTSGLPDAMLTFDGTPARALAGPDGTAWLLDHAIAGRVHRPRRGGSAGARTDRQLCQGASPVRSGDRVLPGRQPARR